MKKKFANIVFSTLVILSLLLTLTPLAAAQGNTRVYLQEVESAGDTVTVDVQLENVTDLYGVEFRLKYDPAMLAVQDLNTDQNGIQVEPGAFLPVDKGFVVANKVDEAEGKVTYAITMLNPAPPVSGQGTLARVSFKVLQGGPTTIDIEQAKLVSSGLQTIASETTGLSIAGDQAAAPSAGEVPPAAGGSSFNWWIVVAVGVMLLGVVLLGGLIVMGGGKSRSSESAKAQPPQKPEQQPQKQPQTRPSGGRPSAFKQQNDLAHKPQQSR